MSRRVLIPLIVVAVGLGVAAGYHLVAHKPTSSGPDTPESTKATAWNGRPTTLMSSYHGRVLVLLLGMEGCNGTHAATEFLKKYVEQLPDGASIVRLDVPPPVGEFKTADAARLPFACGIDKDRLIAEQLDFFYYPTLYIFDRDGELRFSGGCDPERVPQMVAEIAGEAPGAEKHTYTPPLPAVGTTAPAFTGTTLDGKTVALDELRGTNATVLIFAKTKCRFTMRAFPGMQQLADSLRDKGVAVAIVNRGEPAEVIRPIYAERAPGVTVVVDESRAITNAYSVTAAPFLFLLDAEGRIVARMPYTFDDATRAVEQLLGLASDAATAPQTGAG